MAEVLKQSRVTAPLLRQGPSRVRLQVAGASEAPRSNAVATGLRAGAGMLPKIWVDKIALLTESDVRGALASWDCGLSAMGREEASIRLFFSDQAAQTLRSWSEHNHGAMLAVVVNDEALAFARVAATLGDRLSVCLPGTSLEDAEALGAAIAGSKR